MSVSVNRKGNPDGTSDYTIPVSGEDFYWANWYPASKELGVKIFYDGSRFTKDQVPEVLRELELLKGWAKANLTGYDLEYMVGRTESLQQKIPDAFDKDDTILYIY